MPAEVPVVEAPTHTRAKRGRKPLPDNLPRIIITHDLPEDQKFCACGACLKRIGEEVSPSPKPPKAQTAQKQNYCLNRNSNESLKNRMCCNLRIILHNRALSLDLGPSDG